jgi:hypothetical protein
MIRKRTINWELVDRLAADLDVDYWARRKWQQRKHVPHKWRLALIAASRGAIRPEHFVEMDRTYHGG